MEDGCQWGTFVSEDGNALKNSTEEERKWVILAREARWRAGEVREAGWKGTPGVRGHSWCLGC